MLYIVDGTGDISDDDYKKNMASSFCNRLYGMVHASVYRRGPTWVGATAGSRAVEFMEHVRRAGANEKIFLCGYSRGGAYVVGCASELEKQMPGRRIDAVFLFDAVDSDISVDGKYVPSNVANCYHAIRDREFARRYEKIQDAETQNAKAGAVAAVAFAQTDIRQAARSALFSVSSAGRGVVAAVQDVNFKQRRFRSFMFDNCALEARDPNRTVFKKASFPSTHGGMGGVPWPDVEGDRDGSTKVWAWMKDWLLAHGLLPR